MERTDDVDKWEDDQEHGQDLTGKTINQPRGRGKSLRYLSELPRAQIALESVISDKKLGVHHGQGPDDNNGQESKDHGPVDVELNHWRGRHLEWRGRYECVL